MVVFLGIRPGQVPEEPQPEGLDPFRDWQAACSVPNRLICRLVCLVYGIRRIFPDIWHGWLEVRNTSDLLTVNTAGSSSMQHSKISWKDLCSIMILTSQLLYPRRST